MKMLKVDAAHIYLLVIKNKNRKFNEIFPHPLQTYISRIFLCQRLNVLGDGSIFFILAFNNLVSLKALIVKNFK